jgi:hypothetical protein
MMRGWKPCSAASPWQGPPSHNRKTLVQGERPAGRISVTDSLLSPTSRFAKVMRLPCTSVISRASTRPKAGAVTLGGADGQRIG